MHEAKETSDAERSQAGVPTPRNPTISTSLRYQKGVDGEDTPVPPVDQRCASVSGVVTGMAQNARGKKEGGGNRNQTKHSRIGLSLK